MIQAAWLWIKHQPKSTLTRWFLARTMGQGRRVKRIMIVAVARKLAIALWRYVEHGLVPQGAILVSPAATAHTHVPAARRAGARSAAGCNRPRRGKARRARARACGYRHRPAAARVCADAGLADDSGA